MTKSMNARADEIAARLNSRAKPCIVARHPEAALIDALIERKVPDLTIEQEFGGQPSDTSIKHHRRGLCTCRRT